MARPGTRPRQPGLRAITYLAAAAVATCVAVVQLLDTAGGISLPAFCTALQSAASVAPRGVFAGRTLGPPESTSLVVRHYAKGRRPGGIFKRQPHFRETPFNITSHVERQAGTPQIVPVFNMDGEQIGEEDYHLRTFARKVANFRVHLIWRIWRYQKTIFFDFLPRRGDSDVARNRKPWPQKGTGRARHGDMVGPLWGKSKTRAAARGADSKKNMLMPRTSHALAISTVLHSKWRCMKIVAGLEEWESNRMADLIPYLRKMWPQDQIGAKNTLIITRGASGSSITMEDKYNHPLRLAGMLIPKLHFRTPRDIDPSFDGLKRALEARRIIISREAYFDILAKFGAYDGWVYKRMTDIYLETLTELAKEYPAPDRKEEYEAAMEVPYNKWQREEWAKAKREELAAEKVA